MHPDLIKQDDFVLVETGNRLQIWKCLLQFLIENIIYFGMQVWPRQNRNFIR